MVQPNLILQVNKPFHKLFELCSINNDTEGHPANPAHEQCTSPIHVGPGPFHTAQQIAAPKMTAVSWSAHIWWNIAVCVFFKVLSHPDFTYPNSSLGGHHTPIHSQVLMRVSDNLSSCLQRQPIVIHCTFLPIIHCILIRVTPMYVSRTRPVQVSTV